MQYILSEDELKKFENLSKSYQKSINSLCQLVCDNMPVKWNGWSDETKKPWACIYSKSEWYCDGCPVQDFCEMEKSYSQ